MRRSLPTDEDANKTGRFGKVLNRRKKPRSTRPIIRSNSVSALACKREATIAATAQLCQMYRLSMHQTSLPVMDTLLNSASCVVRSNLSSMSRGSNTHPAFLDLPIKSMRLVGVNRWDFDVFTMRRQYSDQLVCSLGIELFELHNLFRILQLDRLTVMRALAAIESVYWEHNPYHTAVHAADVAQALHCFIRQTKLYGILQPAEIFASLLAALVHDADHPGMNQSCLQRTGNFLVNLYDSTSVLEQHHARVGLSILHQSGITRHFTSALWTTVRECMVQMVHATDMAQQAYYKAKFTTLVDAKKNQQEPVFSSDDRILLLQISLKCADISNPCRPWNACYEWAHRICAEFFSQGDQERLRWSLTPTLGCDRNGSSIPRIQTAFIDNLIRPLFTKFDDFFRSQLTEEILRHLNNNYHKWQQQNVCSAGDVTDPRHMTMASRTNEASNETVVKSGKKPRKVLKGNPGNSKKTPDYKTAAKQQQQSHVSFQLDSLCPPGSTDQSSGDKDYLSRSGLQTFFITTRGMRRHSLPETQIAIKKTFDFTPSKKASPQLTHTNISNALTPSDCPTSSAIPSVRFFYVNKPATALTALRTASANILQTLCEEIINQEPLSKSRAFELNPFPLPDAWNVTNYTASNDRAKHVTGLAINLSMTNFMALANRRSSVPLIEK